MKTNGRTTTAERTTGFNLPPFEQQSPKSQPLVKAEQLTNQITAKFDLVRQKQELEVERLMGKVAAMNSAQPIIKTVIGDANHNLQQLTRVIIERGCDIAEDCIELIIDDEA